MQAGRWNVPQKTPLRKQGSLMIIQVSQQVRIPSHGHSGRLRGRVYSRGLLKPSMQIRENILRKPGG